MLVLSFQWGYLYGPCQEWTLHFRMFEWWLSLFCISRISVPHIGLVKANFTYFGGRRVRKINYVPWQLLGDLLSWYLQLLWCLTCSGSSENVSWMGIKETEDQRDDQEPSPPELVLLSASYWTVLLSREAGSWQPLSGLSPRAFLKQGS